MKAIIYCRVSTKEQAERGYSLEAQESACRKFALSNGYGVDEVFIERGESAKRQNRTELMRLIKYAVKNKKKLCALIIWKYDRLARDLSHQTELVKSFSKSGIRVLSATENNEDNATGRLMRNIIGSFAQYENDLKSERTINGMKQAVKEGRWCWHAPIGYRHSRDASNKPIIEPSEESEFVLEAFRLAETGTYKQTEIVGRLRQRGCATMTKGRLNRILRNPLYAGFIKVDWFPDYIDALHKPLVSKDTFFRVQMILDGKRPRIVPKLRNHPDFPLRNFVRCGKCAHKLTGSWSRGRNKKYPYYHCPTKGCSLYVRKEELETKFYEYLHSFQPNQDILGLFEAVVLDVWKTKREDIIEDHEKLQKELRKLEEKGSRIEDLVIRGVFDEETYKKKSEEVQNEIMLKQAVLSETKIELNDIEACLNYCKFFLSNLAKLWASAGLNLKQRFQTLIFPEGISFDGKRFGTARTATIFKYLRQNRLSKSHLAPRVGLEPVG